MGKCVRSINAVYSTFLSLHPYVCIEIPLSLIPFARGLSCECINRVCHHQFSLVQLCVIAQYKAIDTTGREKIFFCMNEQREFEREYTKWNGDMKFSQLIAVSSTILQNIYVIFARTRTPNNDKYHRGKFICLWNINGFGRTKSTQIGNAQKKICTANWAWTDELEN